MSAAAEHAFGDFRRVMSNESSRSLSALGALHQSKRLLWQADYLLGADKATIKVRVAEIEAEMADRLSGMCTGETNDNYFMVRGILLSTDLDGKWSIALPVGAIHDGVELGGERITMNIPSVFMIHAANKDWPSASRLAAQYPSGFVTAGLKAWRAVALAHAKPHKMEQLLDVAAVEFATDTYPSTPEELTARGGHWSAINVQLWSRYFRSRARLLEAFRVPKKAQKALAAAAEAWGESEVLYTNPDAMRLKQIASALSTIVTNPGSFDGEKVARDYRMAMRITGEQEEDTYALEFIKQAAEAFRGYANNPELETTHGRLSRALEALAKVPVIGPAGSEAIRPAVGESAHRLSLGHIRTWMHTSVGQIRIETHLQKLLLRLLQAGLPKYAQIRHGPIEYGKDLAVLVAEQGRNVLRLYQVKCGDINKKVWRDCQHELEEAFLVPLKSPQLPVLPDVVEVVLITNGHANPHVEPVIEGWLKEQKLQGRSVTFMHLDSIVDWVVESHLTSELRSVLEESKAQITRSRLIRGKVARGAKKRASQKRKPGAKSNSRSGRAAARTSPRRKK
jgi:hypothetical protein